MSRRTTLILDRRSILPLVDMKPAMAAVEKVFREYGLGRALMPPKIYLDLPRYRGDFRAMPSYSSGLDVCSLKWVNAHSGNAAFGLPAVMAVILLSDPKTGFPLCVMDGTYLTAVRTGACGGVAAKYLARPESRTIALVGCGAQAKTQLAALREVFSVKSVKVWGKENSLAGNFVKTMKKDGEIMSAAATVRECVIGADIVVTTTPSRKPIVDHHWIGPGTHINAIGADAEGKQELDPQILQNAKIVVDDIRQASHSGEINVPFSRRQLTNKDIYAQLGQIVCGKKKGRIASGEITVFDSTGLAIQDLAVANLVYRKARARNIGKAIDLLGV